MQKIANKEGQFTGSTSLKSAKKRTVKAFGFLLFLIGAFFIIASFFNVPITGHSISTTGIKGTASLAGIALEIIGIVLMLIKTEKTD
jgi:predicted phage tail protein